MKAKKMIGGLVALGLMVGLGIYYYQFGGSEMVGEEGEEVVEESEANLFDGESNQVRKYMKGSLLGGGSYVKKYDDPVGIKKIYENCINEVGGGFEEGYELGKVYAEQDYESYLGFLDNLVEEEAEAIMGYWGQAILSEDGDRSEILGEIRRLQEEGKSAKEAIREVVGEDVAKKKAIIGTYAMRGIVPALKPAFKGDQLGYEYLEGSPGVHVFDVNEEDAAFWYCYFSEEEEFFDKLFGEVYFKTSEGNKVVVANAGPTGEDDREIVVVPDTGPTGEDDREIVVVPDTGPTGEEDREIVVVPDTGPTGEEDREIVVVPDTGPTGGTRQGGSGEVRVDISSNIEAEGPDNRILLGVGDGVIFNMEIVSDMRVVNSSFEWKWDEEVIECAAFPDFDSSEVRCEAKSPGVTDFYIEMGLIMENGMELRVESNRFRVRVDGGQDVWLDDSSTFLQPGFTLEENKVYGDAIKIVMPADKIFEEIHIKNVMWGFMGDFISMIRVKNDAGEVIKEYEGEIGDEVLFSFVLEDFIGILNEDGGGENINYVIEFETGEFNYDEMGIADCIKLEIKVDNVLVGESDILFYDNDVPIVIDTEDNAEIEVFPVSAPVGDEN